LVEESGAAPQRQGRGCFFWGCLTVFLLTVLLAAVVGGVSYYMYSTANRLLATEPLEIPAHQVSPEEYEAVQSRLKAFGTPPAVAAGGDAAGADAAAAEQPARLELTTKDLNDLLLGGSPALKDKVYVRAEKDELFLDVSVPIPEEVPLFGGRFVNGSLNLKPKFVDGEFDPGLESAVFNGEALDGAAVADFLEKFATAMAQQPSGEADLGEGLKKVKDDLKGLKSFEVRDGRVIIER